MKPYITVTKKTLFIVLLGLIIALIVIGQAFSASGIKLDGSTNAMRMEYLKGMKLEPDDSAVMQKEIVLPQEFDSVYSEYNAIQKKAGFDLSKYKGEKATVYTYPLSDPYKFVHLIVREGEIIGGDISSIKLDGEMLPLSQNEKQ